MARGSTLNTASTLIAVAAIGTLILEVYKYARSVPIKIEHHHSDGFASLNNQERALAEMTPFEYD